MIRIKHLTLQILLLFPIFTLFSAIPGANTLISVLGLGMIIAATIKSNCSVRSLLLSLAALSVTVIALCKTDFPIINKNEAVYLVYMCIYFAFICDSRESMFNFFQKNSAYIKAVCIIWNAAVLFSIPFAASYKEGVFVSFSKDTFRLSQSTLFIISLVTVLIVTKGRKYIWLSFLPFLAIMLGASRTYLLVGALCMAINLYFAVENKQKYVITIIILTICCSFVIAYSSMGDKIMRSFSEQAYMDSLQVFTSGRSKFWLRILDEYAKQPLTSKIFGCGFNFVREINGADLSKGESGIWAHNDFIQLLATNGIVGICIYMASIISLFKKCLQKRVPLILRNLPVLIWFFNAMFNMYYTYVCSMISLPIMILACDYAYREGLIMRSKKLDSIYEA